jgi:CheY-like chemotaxis protein
VEGGLSGFSILVVEDDEKLRAMLRRTLRGAGWHVRVAEDGREALESFGSETPDLLLTDIDMPNMNGIELVARVRERYPDLPVVFMSGNPEAETSGLSPHFLPKPFLLESLDGVLARASAAAAARRSVAG